MTRLILAALLVAGCGRRADDTGTDDTGLDDLEPTFNVNTQKRSSDAARRGELLQVALMQVTVESSGEWTLGEQLAVNPITGTGNIGVILPLQAPDAHIGSIDGGRSGALYLPVAFDDRNRSDVFEEGADDLVLGFSEGQWLAWLDDPGSGEPAGWFLVDRTGEEPDYRSLAAQSVIDLWGLGADGQIRGVLTPGEDRIGVVSIDAREFDGGEPSDFRAWSAMPSETGLFNGLVTPRPPADAYQFPDEGVRFARLANVLFVDNDESGDYTPDIDVLLDRALCYEGERLDVRFVDTPRSVEVARILARDEQTSGWRFVTGDQEHDLVGQGAIQFGDGCAI